MGALMLRHLTINGRTLLILTPLLCCLLASAFKGTEPALLIGIMLALSLSSFVIINGEAMDPNVERFLLSLPVSREGLVREGYLSGLLALLVGQLLPLLAVKAGHALAPGHVLALNPSAWGVAALVFLAMACLIFCMLPFRFALGGPRGLAAFAIALVSCLAGLVAWKGMGSLFDGALELANRMLDHPAQGTLGALGVLSFGGLSLTLSTRLYRRRAL